MFSSFFVRITGRHFGDYWNIGLVDLSSQHQQGQDQQFQDQVRRHLRIRRLRLFELLDRVQDHLGNGRDLRCLCRH